jgi:hypothetical protein
MSHKLRRVQPGEPITAAAYNRLVDAVNMLLSTTASFPIEIHQSAAGVHIGLAHQPRLELIEVQDVVQKHDKDKTAKVLTFNFQAASGDDKWQDSHLTTKSVTDIQESLYLPGERRLCHFNANAGKMTLYEGLQWHVATLSADLSQAGSATADVLQQDKTDGSFSDSGNSITVYDALLSGGETLASGSRVLVMQLVHSRLWIVIAAGACPTAGSGG